MKKATLNLKEMPGGVVRPPAKKEKKRGGLAWFWDKITSPFSGTEALEGTGSLTEEAGGFGQQFDELAARVAARVGAEASPWIGKAIMAAVAAGVVGTGILAARHFMGNSGSFKSPYGAIASGINAHPSGPNGLSNEAPAGSIGAGENTTAGANTTAGKAATTPNTGKAAVVNIPTPQGEKAQNPGSLAMPSNSSFGGGAPIGESGAAPQYAAQAAQEAAMAKNAIAWSPQASVSPMSIRGGAINLGSMGFRGGKAFGGGRSLAALRNAVGYNAGMNGASYSGDAQNAINQFDNQMTSGGGISQGGITTGSADSANSVGGNTPSMMGGSGSGSGSNANIAVKGAPVVCDISVACNAQQMAGGGIADVTTAGQCTCSNYQSSNPTQVTPWQGEVNSALGLLFAADGLMAGGAALCAAGLASMPFGAGLYAAGAAMLASSIVMAGTVINMATIVGKLGGHQEALVLGIAGITTIAGDAVGFFGAFAGAWLLAALVPFLVGLTALIGPGITQTPPVQSNLQVDDNSMQSTENQINSLQSQINSDQSQIAADQANLAQEEALPQTRETKAQIAQDNAQIAADNTQIENDQNQISNTLIPNLQQEISQTQADSQQNGEQKNQLKTDEAAQQAIISQYNGSNGQPGQLAADQATLKQDQQAQANEASLEKQITQDESQIYQDNSANTNPTQVAADQAQLTADQATLATDKKQAGQLQSAQNQVNSDNTAVQNAQNQYNADKQQITTDKTQGSQSNTDIANAQNLLQKYGILPNSGSSNNSSSSSSSGSSSGGNNSGSSSNSNGGSSGGTFITTNPNQ